MVTSFEVAKVKYLYTVVYCGRGEAELFIKECKLGLGGDTSPCQKATGQTRSYLVSGTFERRPFHRLRRNTTVPNRDVLKNDLQV